MGSMTIVQRVERKRRIAHHRWRLLTKISMRRAEAAWSLLMGWDRKHHEVLRGF
jgi:hypothetical protein